MASYGLVSLRGVMPLSSSYDHVGPMTRTVRDAALVLQAIAGHDPADITSLAIPVADYVAAVDSAGARLRIGPSLAPHFFADLDPEVAAAIERALATLANLGAEPSATSRRPSTTIAPCSAPNESYAYHRRWMESSPERYQPETLRRLRTGAEVIASDYIEKWQHLQQLRRGSGALFDGIDLIVTPTVPMPAPSFAGLEAEPTRCDPRSSCSCATPGHSTSGEHRP